MIEEGETVPKFQLYDANGELIKSSDLKGKKHVIYFYPRDLLLVALQKQMNFREIIKNSKNKELKL